MKSTDIRAVKANHVTWVGFFVNLILVAFKLVAGIIGNSAAMIADALHSLSDFATDIVILASIRVVGKPVDQSHDYGHGKFETLAAAATIMLTVLSLLGLIHLPQGLLLIPMAFWGGLAFGAIGMFFTGIIPTIDMFNLPIFLFITPMFLFSGTFFPVSNLPQWIRPLALAFPLYHLTELAPWFSLGIRETKPIASIGYLTFFILFFTHLALKGMRKRLIR